MYLLNEGGAEGHAAAAAEDTLREYLENDFDPVPCPVCGHYQRYMFPKLYEATPPWLAAARFVALTAGSVGAVLALYWTLTYLQQPTHHALVRVVATWSLLAVLGLIGVGLAAIERSKARRFDPNTEDQQARIDKGRSRAVTRAEFEAAQQRERGAGGGAGTPDHGAEAGADFG